MILRTNHNKNLDKRELSVIVMATLSPQRREITDMLGPGHVLVWYNEGDRTWGYAAPSTVTYDFIEVGAKGVCIGTPSKFHVWRPPPPPVQVGAGGGVAPDTPIQATVAAIQEKLLRDQALCSYVETDQTYSLVRSGTQRNIPFSFTPGATGGRCVGLLEEEPVVAVGAQQTGGGSSMAAGGRKGWYDHGNKRGVFIWFVLLAVLVAVVALVRLAKRRAGVAA
jgi:hypothetical protein